MTMTPTVHIRAERDKPRGLPTTLCGVGGFATAFQRKDRPATCRVCLERVAATKGADDDDRG